MLQRPGHADMLVLHALILVPVSGAAGRRHVSIVREDEQKLDELALRHTDTFVRENRLTACKHVLEQKISALPVSFVLDRKAYRNVGCRRPPGSRASEQWRDVHR